MNKAKIVLVGMPCSGKTTWGKKYAHKYGLNFFDLDDLITKETNTTINDIILKKGENQFRIIENKTLLNFLNKTSEPYILACGGGTPCFYNNMPYINKHCLSVFIDVPISEIFKRLKTDDKQINSRPLFKDKDPIIELNKLYEKRLSYYKQAKIILDTPSLDIIKKIH